MSAQMGSRVRVANAPCSWGVMKGFEAAGFPPYRQVLDEIAGAGYEGTELGDWGFLPTDARTLSGELAARRLALVGALVPVPLADRSRHNGGIQDALRTARLLKESAGVDAAPGPFVILADANGSDRERTRHAGRIQPGHGLKPGQWRTFAQGAEAVARVVLEETGLRTAFHHHCAGFVETPAETETLLDLTDPALVGVCFDTGHYAYAGGDPLDGLRRMGERVWHVHFKDCHPQIAARARAGGWDYFRAVREGVFYGIGGGAVDFATVVEELRRRQYDGWVVVEDELPPGLGQPLEGARRDRQHLRDLGL